MFIVMGGLIQLFYGEYEHEKFCLNDSEMAQLDEAVRTRPGVAEKPFERNVEASRGSPNILSRGDVFCEYAVVFAIPPPHLYTAVALERSMILSLPKEAYLRTVEVFPQLRTRILRQSHLNDTMHTEVARHFGNEPALRMGVAISKMLEKTVAQESEASCIAREMIGAENSDQWDPITPAQGAMANATIYGLQRWLDAREGSDAARAGAAEAASAAAGARGDGGASGVQAAESLPATTETSNAVDQKERRRRSTFASIAGAPFDGAAQAERMRQLEASLSDVVKGQARLEALLLELTKARRGDGADPEELAPSLVRVE